MLAFRKAFESLLDSWSRTMNEVFEALLLEMNMNPEYRCEPKPLESKKIDSEQKEISGG